MKEATGGQMQGGGGDRNEGGHNGSCSGRSAMDKEKTKIRERKRRSITTKIFHGLRKHGGYRLSPRADINEVLRHLAMEAGWLVEPDGTTYRPSSPATAGSNMCPVCGTIAGRKSGTPTPTSSFIGSSACNVGGECSTTASPGHNNIPLTIFTEPTLLMYHPVVASSSSASTTIIASGLSSSCQQDPPPLSIYGRSLAYNYGLRHPSTTNNSVVVGMPTAAHQQQQQQMYLQEARASTQNTPVGSPQCHA